MNIKVKISKITNVFVGGITPYARTVQEPVKNESVYY